MERADTTGKLLAWSAHLHGKNWFTHTDWSGFLYGQVLSRSER